MNESKISVRYSRALFESAFEKNILDEINKDMSLIYEVSSYPDVKDLLKNPVIPASRKLSILNSIFGKSVNSLTMSLIGIVVKNGRENYIPAIARVFRHETMKYRGITEAVLTTAVKVDSKISGSVSALISKMFDTRVELKELVDKDIIGGFILRIDDSYIDASIRNKLHKIENELRAGIMKA